VYDSSVAFHELEIVLADPDTNTAVYVGCTYTALFLGATSSEPQTTVITFAATAPVEYLPDYRVSSSAAESPTIFTCSLPPAQFQRDSCACPLVVRTQRTPTTWDGCCCHGATYSPCVFGGASCPIPRFISTAAVMQPVIALVVLLVGLLVI
jgi:hypothetical protein